MKNITKLIVILINVIFDIKCILFALQMLYMPIRFGDYDISLFMLNMLVINLSSYILYKYIARKIGDSL